MTIAEKIEKSRIKTIFTLYREGLFYKCFNEDAMVFVKKVKNYKVSVKFVKSVGATIYSIGFPISEVEKEKLSLNSISEKIRAEGFDNIDENIVFLLEDIDIKSGFKEWAETIQKEKNDATAKKPESFFVQKNGVEGVLNMKTKIILLISTALLTSSSFAQSISGNLSLLTNQSISLEGFNGLESYPISNAIIDEKGNFELIYSKADYGVGYLLSSDKKPLFVLLSGENIVLDGEALSYVETIKITKEKENQWFEQYAKEHPKRDQALSAWIYLEKMYTADNLFALQQTPQQAIAQEKKRINAEDSTFLAELPKDSYVRWFLPMRKLVSGVSTIAQYRPEEIPATIEAFRKLDYTDSRLYKSGLFKDAIESHFWLLENSGKSLDSVFI